ncbi:MAG: DUF1850 domain-containing protein [Actinomycetota bacterium]
MTPGGGGPLRLSASLRARARRHRTVVAVAAVAIGIVAAATGVAWRTDALGSRVELAVVDHDTGEALYARPVEVGERFVLEHTHSVTKRPVLETYSVAAADAIALEELWFDEFGPNLPAGPEQLGGEVSFLHEDGGYRVLHHGYVIGEVPLRVGGPEVDHSLTFADGERIRLLDFVPRGAWVDLEVRGR